MKFNALFVISLILGLSFQSSDHLEIKDQTTRKLNQNKVRLVANGSENIFGVGYSIDVAKARYLDAEEVKDNAPIFDETWLNQTLDQQKVKHLYKTETFAVSDNFYKSLNQSLSSNCMFSSFLGGAIDIFTANTSRGFSQTAGMRYKDSGSKYMYALNYQYKNYEFSFPKYSSDSEQFRNHLDSSYLSDLRKLLSSEIQADAFFGKYGTHFIAKGIFGGKAEVYYSVTSDTYCLKGDTKATLDEAIKVSMEDALAAGRGISFSFNKATSLQSQKVKELFRAYTTGGSAFSATGITSFNSAFQNWAKSLDDKCGLIGTSKDGLIPLWNILPSDLNTSSNVSYLKTCFNNYVSKCSRSIIDSYDPHEPLFIPDHKTNPEYIKEIYDQSEHLIEDNKKIKVLQNPRLKFDLDDNTTGDYNCKFLKAYGYKKAYIQLYLNIKEVDDGYQHVFLLSINDEKNILHEWKYEHGHGKKETLYSQVCFATTINLWDLDENCNVLYFGFNGSGFGKNRWIFRSPLVHVTYQLD